MEYVHNLIWLCPMLFVAGFIDSIAGGGGLIAMPAYMMCGMPMYYVYGCNKFQCAVGRTAAAYKSFKSGCLDLKITAVSAVSSFLCSFLGTRIIFYLTDAQIRSMLMVLLPLTAVLVIFVKNAWSYTAKEQPLTARRAMVFPGFPPRISAIRPLSLLFSVNGIPISVSFFITYALVSGRSPPISGIWCRSLRMVTISSCKSLQISHIFFSFLCPSTPVSVFPALDALQKSPSRDF